MRRWRSSCPLVTCPVEKGRFKPFFPENDPHKNQATVYQKFPKPGFFVFGFEDGAVRIYDSGRQMQTVCLFDPDALAGGSKAVVYSYLDSEGKTIKKVLSEGAVLPAGAICTCNSVSGTYYQSSGGGGSRRVCTCVPIK